MSSRAKTRMAVSAPIPMRIKTRSVCPAERTRVSEALCIGSAPLNSFKARSTAPCSFSCSRAVENMGPEIAQYEALETLLPDTHDLGRLYLKVNFWWGVALSWLAFPQRKCACLVWLGCWRNGSTRWGRLCEQQTSLRPFGRDPPRFPSKQFHLAWIGLFGRKPGSQDGWSWSLTTFYSLYFSH